MRLRTKILLVAIPTAAVTAIAGAAAIGLYVHRLRRRKATSFLSSDVRNALQELCSLKGEDFVSDGVKASLYQHRLETLTDKQLIGVYVAIKVAEVLRSRGLDIHTLSKEDVVNEVLALHEMRRGQYDRKELLRQLGLFGAEAARSVLSDALLVSGMAMQGA